MEDRPLAAGTPARPAGQYAVELLLAKSRTFSAVLERLARIRDPRAAVEHVSHDAYNKRYRAQIRIGDRHFPLVVKQKVVDEFIEGGSVEAEMRLGRILDLACETHV